MKLVLTKQDVLLIQKLVYLYKDGLPDDGTDKHARFVGKLSKKIKRQFLNQVDNVLRDKVKGQQD